MIRVAIAAIAGAAVGASIATVGSRPASPTCTALLMHPQGDIVASFVDGEWIGDDGKTVEVDHLTRMTAEENCP